MLLLFAFLLGAMLVSFLCSILESVLMSTPISYITLREDEEEEKGKTGKNNIATLFKEYKTDNAKPIAAILSLNTIANTIGAAGVGQQATIVFGSQWFGLVSAVVTILILIFSEIVPKTLGTSYWKSLMGFTANTIHILIYILYPFVLLIEYISRLFPRTVFSFRAFSPCRFPSDRPLTKKTFYAKIQVQKAISPSISTTYS